MKGTISIQWLGHSCFRIDNGVNALVLDPYNESVGYPPLHVQAANILSSHSHGDHSYVSAVDMVPADPDPAYSFDVRAVPSFHDNVGGSQRGPNIIHVIRTCGVSIVHLGDLGHALSDPQQKEIGRPDVLLIPVGGHYTIDAAQAAETVIQLNPEYVIPMHYRHDYGPSVLSTVDPFLDLMKDRYTVRVFDQSTVSMEDGGKKEVWVLTYPEK